MSNLEILLIKQGHQEDQEIEFQISKRLRTEFQDQREADNDESGAVIVNSPAKAEVVAAAHHEEQDDGFKTPTSLNHKIPLQIECPPAPRKPKPSRKRKASSSTSNRPRVVRLLDLSRVVESLYNPTEFQAKIRNSRKDW